MSLDRLFANDHEDNDGPMTQVPWEIEHDDDGIIWIGGERIGPAEGFSIVQGGSDELLSIVFTVPKTLVRNAPKPPPAHVEPAPVAHRNMMERVMGSPGSSPPENTKAPVRCRCHHSSTAHAPTSKYPGSWFSAGGVTCRGNGAGKCSCTHFIAENLCQCGHTFEAHARIETIAGVLYPCMSEGGSSCLCDDMRKVQSHPKVSLG